MSVEGVAASASRTTSVRARLGDSWTAALVFAALSTLLLAPALLLGHSFLPNTILYFIPPWTNQMTSAVAGAVNPVLGDVPTAYYPWWHYARESLRGLSLPQWNPYSLDGTPFLANPQSALFSPFSLPLWLLPFNYAFGVVAALRLWAGSFGAYLLCRELGLSFVPGVVAGLVFGFAPFAIVWLSFPLLNTLALVPWALWLIERLLRRRSMRDVLLLALVLAVALLGGHPGSEIHFYAVVGLYAAIRIVLVVDGGRERVRVAAQVAGAGALGLGAAAVALVPAALAIHGTVGAAARANGGPLLTGFGLQRLFFPDWWGRPSAVSLPGPYNYNERTIYAGTVPLLLAIGACLSRGRWRAKAPFVVLAFVGLEAPLGLEPTRAILTHLPLLSSDRLMRLGFLVPLAVAVLAAFGVERLLARGLGAPAVAAAAAVGAAVGVAGLVSAAPGWTTFRHAARHFLTGRAFSLPRVVELVSVTWWILLAAVLLALLVWARRLPVRAVAAVVLLLVAVDLGHAAWKYNPTPDADAATPSAPPSVDLLRRVADGERLAGIGIVLPPDTAMLYGLRDIRGYDPPQPGLRYMHIFKIANPGQADGDWLQIPALTGPARRVMDLLGARYVVLAPGSPAPTQPRLRRLYRGPDADVYVNEHAVPRAFVPRRVHAVSDESGALAEIRSAPFEPRRDAVVEGASVPAARGTVRMTRDRAGEVVLDADLRRGGLVVLADAYADGWSVDVDGRPARAVRVDSVLRGVVAPAGSHTIRWRYETPGLRLGAIVTLVSVLVAVVLAALAWLRRPRTPPVSV